MTFRALTKTSPICVCICMFSRALWEVQGHMSHGPNSFSKGYYATWLHTVIQGDLTMAHITAMSRYTHDIYIYIYIYTHTYRHTYIHTYIYIHRHTYTYTYKIGYVFMYVCMYVCMYV